MLKRRREAERARLEAYETALRLATRPARSAPDFETALAEAKAGFSGHVVRDARNWRPQMKTRHPGRLRLAAARHLFARFPVAEHLERIWVDSEGMEPAEIMLRKTWFVVAAGGGSLWKVGAGAWLSRKEIHAFLNPLAPVTFEAAFWQAIARSYTDDPGLALRIAHSRIAATPRVEVGFWREAVRFFCANPTTAEEMGDLCDYVAECRRAEVRYSLKGRTLSSLRRQMRAWHRDLAEIARIEQARRRAEAARARARGEPLADSAEGGSWPGLELPDWSWSPAVKDKTKRETYVMTQLRTAAALVAETRVMRHCVSSYAAKCIAGQASIWSLRRRFGGNSQRLLTVEVDRHGCAVQIRGFANRPAYAEETRVLERWAKARDIRLA